MTVFWLELRNSKKSAIAWTISLSAVIFALLAFFPSFQNDSMLALANAKLEGIDPAVLAALGLTTMIDFTVITNFFGYVLQFVTLALLVFVTQRAVNMLVQEETEGTIEFLYAKPVSRGQIFWQKIFAHLLINISMLVIFAAVTVIGYLLFSDKGISAALKESWMFYGSIFFVEMVFMCVGLLASTIVRSAKAATGVSIGIVFGTFIIGMASAAVEKLSFLIYLSPMDWIKSQKLLADGILPQEWIVGIAVILISVGAGCFLYKKRDFLV